MIFIYIGIAQRGTGSEIAPYRPFFDTMIFYLDEFTTYDELRKSVRERIKRTACSFGWDDYYSFMTQNFTTEHFASFEKNVLEWERERVERERAEKEKCRKYQVVGFISVADRPAPAVIRGKIFDNFEDCLKAATELNEVSRANGLEDTYRVQRIS